ncbi:MAG TPA: Clp protease N-terminal domain-containing protein, partial [Spirochaetales bacterium]|nr:Clp protease N-terminal domain-containing protein [Spirochaetales bacterium]
MKVNQQVQAIFNAAYNEAKLRGHEYLTPEHILYASLSFDQVRAILEACDADIPNLKQGMEAYFEQKIPSVKNLEPIQTAGFQSVIERAVLQSQGSGRSEVGIPDVLVSLFDEERNYSAYYLRKSGVNRLHLLEVISHGSDQDGVAGDGSPSGYNASGYGSAGSGGADAGQGGDSQPFSDPDEDDELSGRNKSRASVRQSALEKFTTDLTKMARDGKLELVIGREQEIERTVQVLCRRLKNNPILVGDPGVGK